jgi:hypothetical protein
VTTIKELSTEKIQRNEEIGERLPSIMIKKIMKNKFGGEVVGYETN